MPPVAELSNPVMVLDRVGRVCSWNPAMESLTQVSAEEILGEHLPDSLLSEEHRVQARGTFARAISGEQTEPIKLVLVTGSGAEKVLVAWPTHARADSGEVTATALVGIDTTGMREEADLDGGVHSRTFSHFSHGVAHRFNNLLMVIHGNLQLVRSFKSDHLDEDTMEIVQDALTAAEDGTELVRGLLGISSNEPRDPQVLDINSVVTEFVDVVGSGLPAHTEFVVRVEGDAEVEIEYSQFKSALLHLVLNARESMPGGGSLSLKVAVVHVTGDRCQELGGLSSGHYALIEIRDTGHGIAPSDFHKVREPFFTTRSKSRSLGLGLTFVDDFARRAHGSLTIESSLGVGTKVILALPIIDPQTPQPVQSPRRSTAHPCK